MQGIVISILEVFAICSFIFLALSYFSPDISIFLLSGVFSVQIVIKLIRTLKPASDLRKPFELFRSISNAFQKAGYKLLPCWKRCSKQKRGYREIDESLLQRKNCARKRCILLVLFIAALLQLFGILGVAAFLEKNSRGSRESHARAIYKYLPIIILSLFWSDEVQKYIAVVKKVPLRSNENGEELNVNTPHTANASEEELDMTTSPTARYKSCKYYT